MPAMICGIYISYNLFQTIAHHASEPSEELAIGEVSCIFEVAPKLHPTDKPRKELCQ